MAERVLVKKFAVENKSEVETILFKYLPSKTAE